MSETEIRRLDKKNRIVLPPSIIGLLKIGPGDFVVFDVRGGSVRIVPADVKPRVTP